jgi:predicted RNA-binding protein YlqC (UPF0109 family)
MPTIDEQFVEYIVKSLVGNPDAVKLDRTIDEKGVLLELTVDPEDLGRVIGKRGSTAQSIRTLLRALGTKNDARYNLKIVDVDGGTGRSRQSSSRDGNMADDTQNSDVTDDNITSTDEPKGEAVEELTDEAPAEPGKSETLAEKTRKELADLDDLDL